MTVIRLGNLNHNCIGVLTEDEVIQFKACGYEVEK